MAPCGLFVTDTLVITVDPHTSIFEASRAHSSKQILASPNPVSHSNDFLKIVIPKSFAGRGDITIYDVLGNTLDYQEILINNYMTFHWDLRNSSEQKVLSGTYIAFLPVMSNDNTLQTKKLIIRVRQ